MTTDPASRIPEEVWAEVADGFAKTRPAMDRLWAFLDGGDAQRAPAVPDDDTAWADLEARLAVPLHHVSREASERPPARRDLRMTRFARWGAPMLGVMALALAGILWWRQPVMVHVAEGQMRTVQLPDGSRVELNSGSTLRFSRGMASWPGIPASERRVELDGEGYFEVKHENRPFLVLTANAETQVLGTTFNVRVRRVGGLHHTQVTLASGRVEVRARGTREAVVRLEEAGAVARIGGGVAAAQPERAPLDHVLSWRQRGFVFVSEPLHVILDELERRFDVDVAVEDPALRESRMTVLIARDATPERILTDVCLALDCRFQQTSQGYSVSHAGASPTR